MAVHLHSNNEAKEICTNFENDYTLEAELLENKNQITISSVTEESRQNIFIEKNVHDLKRANPKLSTQKNAPGSESHNSKHNIVSTRDSHELSPFKQAVKGFVLNKLSKKVGSSNILSGIREKIVRKLEDGEEVSILPEKTESLPVPHTKDSFNEIVYNANIAVNPLACELKSVVANDLPELAVVEEATECFEELKSSPYYIEKTKTVCASASGTSISLPNSPIHRITKTSTSATCSNFEQNSRKQDSIDISYLFSDLKKSNDVTCSEMEFDSIEENDELINRIPDEKQVVSDICDASENVVYPTNLYINEDATNFELRELIYQRYNPIICISAVRNMLASLTLPHLILLASIIIHNSSSLPFCITFIFDSLVVAYICYAYLCNITQMQLSTQHSFTNYEEEDTVVSNESKRKYEGSVKILKGNFDPDNPKIITDHVNMCIEDNCLKIFREKKSPPKHGTLNEKDDSFVQPSTYILTDAEVSLVPNGLLRNRVWSRKYPICIAFPEQNNMKEFISEHFSASSDEQEDADLDFLSESTSQSSHLQPLERKAVYFFAVTDREKESWYWELKRATNSDKTKSESDFVSAKLDVMKISYATLLESNSDATTPDIANENGVEKTAERFPSPLKKPALNFDVYIKALFNAADKANDLSDPLSDSFHEHSQQSHECSVDWLNITLGRLFYDFLTQKKWSDDVKHRIQKKLDLINMPTFMESLKVTDVFLGTALPKIGKVSNPKLNSFGLWLNLDFEYSGSFQMTLETKMKIMGDRRMTGSEEGSADKQTCESSESSDEDVISESSGSSKLVPTSVTHGGKLFNMLEKWVNTRHFQNVAKSKFVKKYVGDISNMPLILTVEVNSLRGVLALNIPPAPTDRLWYGFQKDPVLSLTAYPKVGNREINLTQIVQLIEKKLLQEFQKVLVMPNMDDLLIPFMYSSVYDS